MGLSYRRSVRVGRRSRANVSARGVSLSRRAGPVSVSTRGRGSLRLGRGFRWLFKL